MSDQVAVGKQEANLPISAHFICGWPLALVAVGGAIGGGLGGAAYAVNVAIYKSHISLPGKIALNVLTGAAAFVIWALVVGLIRNAQS